MVDLNKTDELIKRIDEFNKKNSIFSKIFERRILGNADEYGVQNSNRKNTKYINTTNFFTLCEELDNAVDTMLILENNEIKDQITKPTNVKIPLTKVI